MYNFIMENRYCVCLITAADKNQANKIAEILVEQRLAACVNIIPQIKSIYRWQEKIEKSEEFLLIAKTRAKLSKDIIRAVKEKHTYSVPEVIFTSIEDGSEEYLDWLGANTLFSSNIAPDKEDKSK